MSFAFLVLLAAGEARPEVALSALVAEALERNPEVLEARSRLEARRARIPQAGALPDPMLMYGVMNEGRPIPFETLGSADDSEVYVGVSQEIPFPGKRRLREAVAREEGSAAEWALEAARRRVAASVAEAYWDLYRLSAAAAVVERSLPLLEQLSRVSRTRLSVGQATQQDVLDGEVELSRLEERSILLGQQRAVVEARLRRLLDRRTADAIGEPTTPALAPLRQELEALLARAEAESPLVLEKAQLVDAAERRLELARREKRPDFGVSLAYHNRGGLDPFYDFGGRLTIPLYAGRKQNRALAEAAAERDAARSAADAARAEVRHAVTEAHLMARAAERIVHLYDEALLKQARLSYDSALAQYQVGKADFLTLVTSWRRLLDHELTYYEQLAEHEKALARLAVHVGIGREEPHAAQPAEQRSPPPTWGGARGGGSMAQRGGR
jgi:outer membrane protein TolC